MTPDITIKVEKDTSNEVLSALLSAVSGRKLKDRVGYNLTRMVQGNLRSLPHNKQGWEPQGFYDKAARGTSYEVTETGAVVSVDNPDAPGAIKFAYNQGQEGRIRIESKGKLLTIPAREEFYGHSAGEFDNLKYVQFGKGGAKALVISTSLVFSTSLTFAKANYRSTTSEPSHLYGLGRGAAGPGRRCTTTAAEALRLGRIHIQSDHAPPPVPIGKGVTGGPESVRDG